MFGAVFGHLASIASDIAKKWASAGALAFIGFLIFVCSIAYALDALHSYLIPSTGTVTASLIIAGGLVALAIGSVACAIYIASPSGKDNSAEPLRSKRDVRPVVSRPAIAGVGSWRPVAAGALVGLAVMIRRWTDNQLGSP